MQEAHNPAGAPRGVLEALPPTKGWRKDRRIEGRKAGGEKEGQQKITRRKAVRKAEGRTCRQGRERKGEGREGRKEGRKGRKEGRKGASTYER